MAFGWKPNDIFHIYKAVCEHSDFFLSFTNYSSFISWPWKIVLYWASIQEVLLKGLTGLDQLCKKGSHLIIPEKEIKLNSNHFNFSINIPPDGSAWWSARENWTLTASASQAPRAACACLVLSSFRWNSKCKRPRQHFLILLPHSFWSILTLAAAATTTGLWFLC